MKFKKIITSLLAASMILSSALPSVFAEEPAAATRGEVVQMLLNAVDDYNPTVQKTDIIKGYEDGQLHEERAVTRAEALVMLKRAFGELPVPTGHNARVALKAGDFTAAREYNNNYYKPLVDEVKLMIDELEKSIYDTANDYFKSAKVTAMTMIVIGMVMLVVITLFAVWIASKITRIILLFFISLSFILIFLYLLSFINTEIIIFIKIYIIIHSFVAI